MDEVNACISTNAEMEELVDQPDEVNGLVRVSGPFTVEGVRPEELSLGEEGLFDPTPNEFDDDGALTGPEDQNIQAYLLQDGPAPANRRCDVSWTTRCAGSHGWKRCLTAPRAQSCTQKAPGKAQVRPAASRSLLDRRAAQ